MIKRSRLPLLTTLAVLFFFYAPLVVMGVYSFNSGKRSNAWKGFTWENYTTLFDNRDLMDAVTRTLIVAVFATVISTVIGTTAAFALHYWKGKLQLTHYNLVYAPLIIPEILMGTSILLFFLALNINLGYFTIIVSHVTFCISYVAMVVLGRLQDFDFSLIEVARDLGANQVQAVTKILLPLIAPGILAGSLLAFTLSMDDFMCSFFVSGPNTDTLPIYIWSVIKNKGSSQVNALSVLLICVTFLIVFISQRLTGGKK